MIEEASLKAGLRLRSNFVTLIAVPTVTFLKFYGPIFLIHKKKIKNNIPRRLVSMMTFLYKAFSILLTIN